MTTVEDIVETERKCHLAKDMEEYRECQVDLNKLVGEVLEERFGPKGHSCNAGEFYDRKIGLFIQNTLHAIGLSLDDVADIQLECEMGTRNVFALITKNGNKIWIKATSTNRPVTLTEIVLTDEVSNVAGIIGEDVPHVIYKDVPNRLIAISDVQGDPLIRAPSVYNTFSPTEIATNTLFEMFLMDADRVRENVRRSGHIISEIDFAAFRSVDTLQQWREGKTSNDTLKRLFNDLDRIQKGEKAFDEAWTRDYIKSMREKVEEFNTNKKDISIMAPTLSKWNMDRIENIFGELETYLDRTETALNKQ